MVDDFKWPVFPVLEDIVVKVTAYEALNVTDSVSWIHFQHVHCSITNLTFSLCEAHTRRGGSRPEVVTNDFHLIITKDGHTRTRGSQIHAHGWFLCHHFPIECKIKFEMLLIFFTSTNRKYTCKNS